MTKPATTVTSWSFSRLSDYRACPLKFKLKHLDKLKEPPSPAMARGAEIHTMAEQYVKGLLAKLPPELKTFAAEFKALRKLYRTDPESMVVEDNWAFTKDWDITTWHDWVNCWVRIKLDCAHFTADGVLKVIDYKTGKPRDDKNAEYMEQLELYALTAMLQSANVQEVWPELMYLDEGTKFPRPENAVVYRRSDIPRLKKLWAARVKPMFLDKTFAPTPSYACRWCFFSAAKNGNCKY